MSELNRKTVANAFWNLANWKLNCVKGNWRISGFSESRTEKRQWNKLMLNVQLVCMSTVSIVQQNVVVEV